VASPIAASDLERARNLLLSSRSAVALTGAGLSTPSGIPDFRSPGSGLWEQVDPLEVASLSSFRYHPERFFRWVLPLARQIHQARPNEAHIALARLEQAGRIRGIVTQNIDDLHRRAGSRTVLEIHGHFREATCVACYQLFPTEPWLPGFLERGEIPRCPVCCGLLKPNVVLFGEQLPMQVVSQARALLASSDLVLVAGSSLEVMPVALFPAEAANHGARLVIINQECTFLDSRADVVFHADVADILPRLAAEVLDA